MSICIYIRIGVDIVYKDVFEISIIILREWKKVWKYSKYWVTIRYYTLDVYISSI